MLPGPVPFFHYKRIRLDARRDSVLAFDQVIDEFKALGANEGWLDCGGFGDDEIAPPFCGSSEPRLGWNLLLRDARQYSELHGVDVAVIADASPLGNGDPFLPARSLVSADRSLRVYVSNFHLRDHALLTPLRSAWKLFDESCRRERQKQAAAGAVQLRKVPLGEVIIRQNPRLKLVNLYVANPTDEAITIKWKIACRAAGQGNEFAWPDTKCELTIAPGCAGYLDTAFQGEEDWVRYLRIWRGEGRQTTVGSIIIMPSMLVQDKLVLSWSSYEPEPLSIHDLKWQDLPYPVTRRLALRSVTCEPGLLDDVAYLAPLLSTEDLVELNHGSTFKNAAEFITHQMNAGSVGPALLTITRLSDHLPVGLCGVSLIDANSASPLAGEYELICWIAPTGRGEGYSYEAACEVLRCAFDSYTFSQAAVDGQIWARIHPSNRRAIKLAERLGMIRQKPLPEQQQKNEMKHLLFKLTGLQFWRGSPIGRL